MSAPDTLSVGIDATAAATARPTGVGLAIAQLVAALQEVGPPGGVSPVVLYRLSRLRRRRHFLPGPARLYHERWSVLLARRLDVFHGPDARLPRFDRPALVATVHDLSARRPGFASDRFRALREGHWAEAARRARLIVTYTQAVADEVARGLGVPRERIAAVPLAPARALATPPNEADRAAARALTGGAPYVLYLGELSRRKNAAGAVEAVARASEREPLARRARLVLVGPAGRGVEEVDAALARAGLGERVVRPDYLPAPVVAALLEGAAAFLFPSRYEGFGMPVLEAFAAGAPVVASRDPSVVEVAGGAALHADADDPEGLGAALARVLADPDLARDLAARGRERAGAFTWERSARRLVDVYRAARAGEPAPRAEVPACSR